MSRLRWAAKMREAIMEDQDEFLMRNPGHTVVGGSSALIVIIVSVVSSSYIYHM